MLLKVVQLAEERQPACEPEAVLHAMTPVDFVYVIGAVALRTVLEEYALAHSVVEAVVGITYPAVRDIAAVPDVVIGTPVTDSPVGTVTLTEVTDPPPPPAPVKQGPPRELEKHGETT